MERLSDYNIKVRYESNWLIYNTISNSIINLNEKEFEEISNVAKNLENFRIEYPLLYKGLKDAGFIIDDYDELCFIKFKNRLRIFSDKRLHLTINPTLDCNLKCWYCSTEYANAIHSGRMSDDMVEAVKKHIKRVVENKLPALHLDWFGGEPLMYFDEVVLPIAEEAQSLCKKNNVIFTQHVTTNSVYITEPMAQEMARLGLNSFQIPIDGNELHHNSIKFNADKTGTFSTIINNINMLAEMIPNVNIIVRINYDKKTLYGIEDIIPLITENAKKHIVVDFQKVWQIKCDEKDHKQLDYIKHLFEKNGLKSGYWAYQSGLYYRCYSDRLNHYAINYDGRIFKCTARNYGDDKSIGKLQQDGNVDWNIKLLSQLLADSTFDNERCLKCKLLPICMGPCMMHNYESKLNGKEICCVMDNVQYSIDNYVIDEAKKRAII